MLRGLVEQSGLLLDPSGMPHPLDFDLTGGGAIGLEWPHSVRDTALIHWKKRGNLCSHLYNLVLFISKGGITHMGGLKDYSGEFRPDLKMEDFSSEALVNLWRASGKLYVGLDGIWYSLIRERYGEEVARELDAEVWKREAPFEVGRVRAALNIKGNDVASVLKFIQTDPGGGAIFPDFKCELRNDKVGILTIERCLGLEYYERHGETELQRHACEVLDVEGFAQAAHLFNPKIKVTALKLPPRKSPDEIACQWEFRLED